MKKIIKNKVYDTGTAKKCAEYEFENASEKDYTWYREELYVKKTGEYFIYGEGNAASEYSNRNGKIKPLTYDEAREWAEKYLDADEYISIFGEPDESDETANLHIQISKAAYTKLKQTAAKQGITLAQAVENLIG